MKIVVGLSQSSTRLIQLQLTTALLNSAFIVLVSCISQLYIETHESQILTFRVSDSDSKHTLCLNMMHAVDNYLKQAHNAHVSS